MTKKNKYKQNKATPRDKKAFLIHLQEHLGFSDVEMYKALGVSRQYWYFRKTYKSNVVPDRAKLEKYAKLFKLPMNQMEKIFTEYLLG